MAESATIAVHRREPDGLVIVVHGRLGLGCHPKFHKAYSDQLDGINRCEVDLSECTGVDSSGMAMLLILRDQAQLSGEQMLISHCNAEVYRALGYANLNQLFTVSPAL